MLYIRQDLVTKGIKMTYFAIKITEMRKIIFMKDGCLLTTSLHNNYLTAFFHRDRLLTILNLSKL